MAYAQNSNFYNHSIKKHGLSAKGVHWNSQKNQYIRFAVLSGFIDNISQSTVVDAGCGMGHYISYLEEFESLPKKYLGVDCESKMIDLAKKHHPLHKFKQMNILEDQLVEADYYLCSGAMNILSLQEMYKFIEKCFFHSKKGFVFNFLSSQSYNNASVDDVIGFCQYLTPCLKTKGDYLCNDFTIFMVKV